MKPSTKYSPEVRNRAVQRPLFPVDGADQKSSLKRAPTHESRAPAT